MEKKFQELKQQSEKQRLTSAQERIQLLMSIDQNLMSHLHEICLALYSDLKKSKTEVLLTEIYPLRQEIKHTINHLKNWMQDTPVDSPLAFKFSQAWIHHEPRGVCLIIAPWNYPFQLAIAPLIAAIAAGNTCMIKPSEVAPHTSKMILDFVTAALPKQICQVIEGDQHVTTALLKLPFHHIFFTGSTAIGKIIMQAASQTLASVTLELGGKSPAVVTHHADIQIAAEKIIWGKLVNCGQTCVAPDYIIVHESQADALISELKRQLLKLSDQQNQTKIINEKHFNRLYSLIEAAKKDHQLLTGQIIDRASLFIDLHVFHCGQLRQFQDRLMTEEIFGPILPIITYRQTEEIFNFFHQNSRPLAFYLFSNSKSEQKDFVQQIPSGGFSINDCLIHVAHPSLPFGGNGESGIGNYHGYAGFLTFSHQKAVFKQGLGGRLLRLFYPPYTKKIEQFVQLMTRFNL